MWRAPFGVAVDFCRTIGEHHCATGLCVRTGQIIEDSGSPQFATNAFRRLPAMSLPPPTFV
jgi:hypothetical protein